MIGCYVHVRGMAEHGYFAVAESSEHVLQRLQDYPPWLHLTSARAGYAGAAISIRVDDIIAVAEAATPTLEAE